MNRQRSRQNTASSASWVWPVMAGLLAVVGAALAVRWMSRPTLETMPIIDVSRLEPEVALLLETSSIRIRDNPRQAAAWGDMGAALRAHDFPPEAEACFRNAQRLDPADYRWPYLLGVCLATRDAPEALAQFRRAASLSGSRTHVQLRLAELLIDQGDWPAAKAPIEIALNANHNNPRAQLAQARLLFAQGQVEEAQAWARKSAQNAPQTSAPWAVLAQVSRRLGDERTAQEANTAIAKLPAGTSSWPDPDLDPLLALRRDHSVQIAAASELAAGSTDPQAAARLAQLALESDDSTAAVHLVQAYLQDGNFDAAVNVLRAQIARHPHHERLHFQLGVALFQRGEFADAASEFRLVSKLKPDHVDAAYNLGHTLLKLEDRPAAESAFASAVRLRPSHAHARLNLARLLLDRGDRAAAGEQIAAAELLLPGNPEVQSLQKRLTELSAK